MWHFRFEYSFSFLHIPVVLLLLNRLSCLLRIINACQWIVTGFHASHPQFHWIVLHLATVLTKVDNSDCHTINKLRNWWVLIEIFIKRRKENKIDMKTYGRNKYTRLFIVTSKQRIKCRDQLAKLLTVGMKTDSSKTMQYVCPMWWKI